MNFSSIIELKDLLINSTNHLPEQSQFEGAANGIFLLQEAYNLNITDLTRGVIKVKKMSENSFLSSSSLKYQDTDFLGKIAYNRGFYDRAVDWFKAAAEIAGINTHDEKKNQSTIANNLVKTMIKTHDRVLEQKGPAGTINGNSWRTNQVPFDEKLRKKKKYKNIIKGMKKVETGFQASLRPDNSEAVIWDQFNRLCRGEELRPASLLKDLSCTLLHYHDPALRLAPFKQEVISKIPFVTMFHHFLAESEILHYKNFARTRLFRSSYGQSVNKGGMGTGVKRTSKQTWLYEFDNKQVLTLNNSLMSIGPYQYRQDMAVLDQVGLGVSDRIMKASRLYNAEHSGGESFQVANYGIGGVYNHHPDPHNWHHPQKTVSEDERPEAVMNGDRVATVMGYLSDVELGGATVFPNAGVTIWPERGSIAMWWNLVSNGLTDQMTIHGGCPVIVGSKWITNKWIRWKPQELKLPCRSANTGFTRQPELGNNLCEDGSNHLCRIDQQVFIRPNYYYESLKNFSPDFR